MPSPEDDTASDSLSLLPLVLKHLPTLHTNPTLAQTVLTSLRKAARSTKSLPLVTPLLSPLTAVALSAFDDSVRISATHTCITLLLALVKRRAFTVARAYVTDLVTAIADIVAHQHGPSPVILRTYVQAATDASTSQLETRYLSETPPVTISVSSRSLAALLSLLAALLSSRDPPQTVPDARPIEPLLWICLGAPVRSNVLNVASSPLLLSARCGRNVAVAAASILERSLDISCGCSVPALLRVRIGAAVHKVLTESAPEDNGFDEHIRVALYRIARLTAPLGRMECSFWINTGVRDAVKDNGLVGQQLRFYSHCGYISPDSPDDSMSNPDDSRPRQPPMKRRRVAMEKTEDSLEDPISTIATQSQSSPVDASCWEAIACITALKQQLQCLESIDSCGSNAASLLILSRVTAVAADAIAHICPNRLDQLTITTEWVAFAHAMGRIIKDVSANIRVEAPAAIWRSLFQLSANCLKLAAVLNSVSLFWRNAKSALSYPEPGSSLSDYQTLLKSVITIINTASISLQASPDVVPTRWLAMVVWKMRDCCVQSSFALSDEDQLYDACRRLYEQAMEGSTLSNDIHRAMLLRGCSRVLALFTRPESREKAEEALPKISTLVTQHSTSCPVLAAAALHSLRDCICSQLQCRITHNHADEQNRDATAKGVALNEETWNSISQIVIPIAQGAGLDDLIAAATNCMGVLMCHAPVDKVAQTAVSLIKNVWHPTSPSARHVALSFVSNMTPAGLGDGSVHCTPASSSLSDSKESVFVREDSWDGPDSVFAARGDEYDFSRLLGLEVQKHANDWNSALQGDNCIEKIERLDMVPFALVLRINASGLVPTKITGMVGESLLAVAVSELRHCQSSNSHVGVVNSEESTELTSINSCVAFKGWSSCLITISAINEGLIRNTSTGLRMEQFYGLRHNFSSTDKALTTLLSSQTPLPQIVANFFNSRVSEWIPFALHRMLANETFSIHIAQILMDSSASVMWSRVHRDAVGAILRSGDAVSLESLALRVQKSPTELVNKVSADALARAAMVHTNGFDLSPDGANKLIYESLQEPLVQTLARRAGKIVQRLVMELGGGRESRAKSALDDLAGILSSENRGSHSKSSAGSVVASHFMLVMDAVNRGLFHSKVTEQDRFRYLRMLDGVLRLTSEHLHLFVPKIIASLKMALDSERGDSQFNLQTLKVWSTFLKSLGSQRIVPHLASILSILLPYVPKYEEVLSPALVSTIEESKLQLGSNCSEIILLLRIIDHPSLNPTADALEAERQADRDNASEISNLRPQRGSSRGKDFFETCENLGNIISHQENSTIEGIAAEHLLRILRSNREKLGSVLSRECGRNDDGISEELDITVSLLGKLVTHLSKSRNVDCHDKIMQCIGELGAVDPSIVMQREIVSTLENALNSNCKNRAYPRGVYELVAFLLDEFLVPSLITGERRGGSRSRQNRIGLVIQELLRACGCRADTAIRSSKTTRERKDTDPPVDWKQVLVGDTDEENAIFFWENLLMTTRTIAQPYLAEPFDVLAYKEVFGGNSAGDITLACQDVWSKVKAAASVGVLATAEEWRRQIVVQLVDFIGRQGDFGKTLKALRPVLRYEDEVAAYVFPLAVTTALDIQREKESSEIQEFLIREISQVLRDSTSSQPVFDLFDTLRSWRQARCTSVGRMMAREHREKMLHNSKSATGGSSRRIPRVAVESFIETAKSVDPLTILVDLDGREAPHLSLLVQAKSAFAARAYTRAIMMAEYYIRNLRANRGNLSWPSHISSLLGSEGKCREQVSSADATAEAEAFAIMQKSFAELEDVDSMTGVAALRASTSLSDTVIDAETAGRYDEVLISYERALAESPRNVKLHSGFLQCLMTLGHWQTMLSHAEGLASSAMIDESSLRQTAQAMGIEAAWRLGRWDKLESFSRPKYADAERQDVASSASSWRVDFGASFGNMLLSLQQRDAPSVYKAGMNARRHILNPLVRIAREGYSRAYPMVALLHSISDVEDAATALIAAEEESKEDEEVCIVNDVQRLITLSGRYKCTASSLRVREPILSTQRVCFELLQKGRDSARVSLQLAKLAKEANNLRAASVSAFKATSTAPDGGDVWHASVLEMARIRRAQGDSSGALLMVKKEIERLLAAIDSRAPGQTAGEKRKTTEFLAANSDRLCTAYVLAGSWIEEARSEPSEVILTYFEEAAAYGESREEPFYALGRHYDSLLQAGANADSEDSSTAEMRSTRRTRGTQGMNVDRGLHYSRYVPLVIKSFASALCNGHSRIYEALPRMLTVWFDYHTAASGPNSRALVREVEGDVKREIKKAFHNIPLYMWMTAISQLMSRILHPSRPVKEELVQLLARVVIAYPNESCWTILPSSQLRAVDRRKAASEILNMAVQLAKKPGTQEARDKSRMVKSTIQSALFAVRGFVDICLFQTAKEKRGKKDNCAREFSHLKAHMQDPAKPSPIVPTLKTLTVQLPSSGGGEHRPFAARPVRIIDMEDTVLVMSSLMRPRRIGLIGDDGRVYRFLAKRETAGDMRKDSRLVEFITVVNRLLGKDSAARRRDLELKTYAVLPLSEETGMIEWVNDLCPLRTLVREQHLRIANLPESGAIQQKYQSMSDHTKFLEEWAIVKFPPVLDKFFVQNFGGGADAAAWLVARNLWTQSVAVWSMAGYVVGLGDRHGENILIEATTGRCVHVDFAMLFDKGLTLKVPEVVPFRLTQNVVTAMGMYGYEGPFRMVSEVVMGILRRNTDALLGVLETFLHDPLADWGRGGTSGGGGGGVASNEAWQTRGAVKAKLTGMMDGSGLPLSIEGQVSRLIHEACSMENLGKMYLWWSAWV